MSISALTSVCANEDDIISLDASDGENLSSSTQYELRDKQTGLVGTSAKEYYDNPIEVNVGSNVTIQASAPKNSYYLQFANNSKEFVGTDGILDQFSVSESWSDIYSFTPSSDDVGKIFSFKLRLFKETDNAFLYYKVVNKKTTNITLNIDKNPDDNTEVTISPNVLNEDGIINTSDSVLIYINDILNTTVGANESFIYKNNYVNSYTLYAVFRGDENNSKSTSDIYFFSLGNDKFPLNLTFKINSTNIAPDESIKITPVIKNAEGEDVNVNVDIYEVGCETALFTDVLNGDERSFTPNSTHQSGSIYQLYAVFRGDENYSKTTSSKIEYKIKHKLNITLTVDGSNNITTTVSSTYVDFIIDCGGYTPDKLNIYAGCNSTSMTKRTFTGSTYSFGFNSNKKGLNHVYVEFEGNDDYARAISNVVDVAVYEKAQLSYFDVEFLPNYAVENQIITITPNITYNGNIVAAGTLKVYNSSSKSDDDLIASVSNGGNFNYSLPDYNYTDSSKSMYFYYDFEGYDDNLFNYYNLSSHAFFYILNTNSLNITIKNLKNDENQSEIIYIDKNDTVTLSVKNLTYYYKYSKVNISVYVDGSLSGYFPTYGDFNSDIGEYNLTFDSENYTKSNYTIYAFYNGYFNQPLFYSNATSNKITVIIMQNTSISLSPETLNIKEGDGYNISASVTGAFEGNITYFDNGNPIWGFTEVPLGTVFTTNDLSIGEHNISASYNAFGRYYPSTTVINTTVTVKPQDRIDISVTNTTYGSTVASIVSAQAGNYTLKINGAEYTNITFTSEGCVNISITGFNPDNYTATIADINKESISNTTSFVILKLTADLKLTATSSKITAVFPLNSTGNAIFTVNKKDYTSSISKGIAVCFLSNLLPGTYNILVKYSGDDIYLQTSGNVKVTIPKVSVKIIAKSKTFKIKKSKKYTLTLKTSQGKALSKVKVTIKVKGKKYSAKTNSKGKATFNLKKLTKKGIYKAKITFTGNNIYNSATKTVKIKIRK